MRVLVTGADGFLGRYLVTGLAGHEVVCASRRPMAGVDWRPLGDLAGVVDWETLLQGVEAVVHLANIAHQQASEDDFERVNHRQTAALCAAAKVAGVADSIPAQEVCLGEAGAALAMVGWGSTFGPIHQAVRRARSKGLDVAHVHIRHIAPMPRNMGELLKSFGRIVVPEMNSGQLKTVLRDLYLVDAQSLAKVSGQPFTIAEIETVIEEALR